MNKSVGALKMLMEDDMLIPEAHLILVEAPPAQHQAPINTAQPSPSSTYPTW